MGASSTSTIASRSWTNHPGVAWTIRILLAAIPFVAGWLALRLMQPYFLRSGRFDLLLWIVQAVVVSSVIAYAVARLARRFTPLVLLFDLSLVFPDHAPSRFGVALRASSVRKLHARTAQTALSDDVQTAAEEAVGLVMALGRHDRLTRGHTERVRAYADVIGQEMGLAEDDLEKLRWGVLLHDIGKVSVPPEILNKPGAPDDAEWEILRGHPAAGAELLRPLEPWLGEWVRAAGEHHERWDGSGYPAGLAGTEISLAGRIAAVADAYDVITSRRSYKAPLHAEAAREELVACSGTDFDPVVVRAMLNAGLRRQSIRVNWAWLFELPAFARVAAIATANQLAVTVGSIATVAAIASGITAPSPEPAPESLAFETTVEREADGPSPTADDRLSSAAGIDSDPTINPPSSVVGGTSNVSSTTAAVADDGGSVTTSTVAGDGVSTPGATTTSIPSAALPTTTTTAAGATPTTTTTTNGATQTTTTNAPTTTTNAPTTTTTSVASDCSRAQSGDGQLAGADLAGCDLSGLVLANFDLSGADLSGADLRDLELTDGTLVGATLAGAQLTRIDVERVDFALTNLAGTVIRDADFTDVSFGFANLAGADLREGTFEGVNFNDANVSDANFVDADLEGVEFFRTVARGAEFGSADLRASRLEGDFENAWFDDADLRNATLTGANFQDARLMFADLEGATGTPSNTDAQFANTTCPDGSTTSTGCW